MGEEGEGMRKTAARAETSIPVSFYASFSFFFSPDQYCFTKTAAWRPACLSELSKQRNRKSDKLGMFFIKELLVVYMGLLLSLDDAVDETFVGDFC